MFIIFILDRHNNPVILLSEYMYNKQTDIVIYKALFFDVAQGRINKQTDIILLGFSVYNTRFNNRYRKIMKIDD